MPAKPPVEDTPLRRVEREIIEGEIGILEQQALILSLRTRGLATAAAERAMDQMEARLIELWARRATMVRETDPRTPKGKLQ